jgi:hypothetical protein
MLWLLLLLLWGLMRLMLLVLGLFSDWGGRGR